MKIHALSALEMQRALDARELSSVDLVEALLARRRAVDPKVRAIVVDLGAQAREQARQLDEERRAGRVRGPLHGLPITVKENIELQGTACTLGVEKRRGMVSQSDAVTVRLAKEAGAIVLGKTNVPQTLLAMETTNFIYGTTNNPWALDRSPGGSSGGESAAIASGSSVLGIGTDIGGSVRIPAAFAGVAALKPTLHRWSNRGSVGLFLGQEVVRSQMGPLARSAAEVAMFFRALDPTLHARHDPEVAPLPAGDPSAVALRGLRVGVYEDDGYVTPCASSMRAVRQAAEALERAGCEVVPFTPPRAVEHYAILAAATTADGLATLDGWLDSSEVIRPVALNRRLAGLPKTARSILVRSLELVGERRAARALAQAGERTVQEYWRLTWDRTGLQRAEHDRWQALGLDAVLCPATTTPAVHHGASADMTPAACYTIRYNVLNLPAGVVSVTLVRPDETERPQRADRIDKRAAAVQRGSAGLPIGVQVVGRPYREDVVLALMQHIESEARDRGFPPLPIDPA